MTAQKHQKIVAYFLIFLQEIQHIKTNFRGCHLVILYLDEAPYACCHIEGLIMLVAEKFSTPVEIQRRASNRVPYIEPCFAQTDNHSLWVKSINLSEGGMCIAVDRLGVLKRGTGVAIFIQNFPALDARVQWTRANIAGLKFTSPIEENPDFIALIERLKSGEPAWLPVAKPDIDSVVGHSIHDLLNPKSKVPEPTVTEVATQPLAQVRAHERLNFDETCWVETDKRKFQAQGMNISEGGMCLRLNGLGTMHNGTDVRITFEGHSPIDATLRWSKERVMGFQFLTPIKDHPILRDRTPIED